MSKLVIPGVIAQSGNGGGGGTVDQTYDPTSTNAQSGTAVAEAVAPCLQNTSTGTNSLTILGTAASTNSSVNIGANSYTQSNVGVAIGYYAKTGAAFATAIGSAGSSADSDKTIASGLFSVAVGYKAQATQQSAIQLGTGTNSTANSFQVFTFQMLDGTTGKIPMARLPIVQLTQADYDALVSGGTVDANTIYCIVPA